MRRTAAALSLATLVACAAPAVAHASSEYVIDEADIVPSAVEQRIDAIGSALEAATGGAEVAVVTVRSLGDETIEEYGIRRARELGVGDAEKDRGVVLFIAPNDKKVRIEVGYGLEGAIPDSKAGAIISDVVRPRFRSGDVAGSVEAGYRAIAAEVAHDAGVEVAGLAPADRVSETASKTESAEDAPDPRMVIAVVVVLILIIGIATLLARKSGGGTWSGPSDWGGSSGSSGGGFGGGSSSSGGGFGGGGFGGGGASGDL